MPEPLGLLFSTPETKAKAPIIKVSCGIGDTDGYPAFDVDSEAYATKDDSRWGFLITGGAEFHMPLTVFQVSWGYGYWLRLWLPSGCDRDSIKGGGGLGTEPSGSSEPILLIQSNISWKRYFPLHLSIF